jgi:phosphoglycerate dehydrogenase-like enzyme
LHGKTALILGTGAIGTTIANYLKPFNVKCLGIRKSRKSNSSFDLIGTIDELHKFLPLADFIIITLPLNKETENLIGETEFKIMKQSVIIINVGRSRVINEKALFNALKENRIKGAGIDVVYLLPWEQKESEKKMNNFPFHELENVTISPYRAWTSDYTFTRTAMDIARKLDLIANKQPLPDKVIEPKE